MHIILSSVLLLAVLAALIGIFLGISSEMFKVEVDEKVAKIRESLPGNNCGGCGYAGCDALAEAISKGLAATNQCPVGGAKVAKKIAAIMGTSEVEGTRMVAHVRCNGTCTNANKIYDYSGTKDCRIASLMPNAGEKSCSNACIGYGSCVSACQFDAIVIVDGVAKVDEEKCVACKACVNVCPKKVIELVPYGKKHLVNCSNKDKGKIAMDLCKVSCIACGLCERTCEKKAIKVISNISIMDYSICNDCGACSEKCPRKCIS